MTPSSLPHSDAADRNKQAIRERLQSVLTERGRALEIASGTGQHAVWFAASMPGWLWQPTDADARMLPAISGRIAQSGLSNVLAPVQLDVMQPQWPALPHEFDAIYCANMLHIAPWAACAALMAGAARHLSSGGMLITYGPYFEDGVATAASNVAFDKSLRSRNSSWGIRNLADVDAEARRFGLARAQRHAMPANNLLLVFGRM